MRDREADEVPPPKERRTDLASSSTKPPSRALGFKVLRPRPWTRRFRYPRTGIQYEIIGVAPDFSRTIPFDQSDRSRCTTSTPSDRFSRLNLKLRGASVPETLRAIDKLWSETPGQTRPISAPVLSTSHVQSHLCARCTRQRTIFAHLRAGGAASRRASGCLGWRVSPSSAAHVKSACAKAMGAETGDVMRLLLWQFAKPVLWANVIAWPVAGYIMYRWLLRLRLSHRSRALGVRGGFDWSHCSSH